MIQDIHHATSGKVITESFEQYEKPNRWLLYTVFVVSILAILVAVASGRLAFSGSDKSASDNATTLNSK